MPVYADAETIVKENLQLIAEGKKAPVRAIGRLTDDQLREVNRVRAGFGLFPLEDGEILFMGRHHYESRCIKDSYTIHDAWLQIESALSATSEVLINAFQTTLQNTVERDDGYGHKVHDRGVLECTKRKPKAEIFSAMPRGDGKYNGKNKKSAR